MRSRAVNVKKFSLVATVLLVTNCIISVPELPIEGRHQVLTLNQLAFMKHFDGIRASIKSGAFNSDEKFNRASSRLTFLFSRLTVIDSFWKNSFPGSVSALEQRDISDERAFSDYLKKLRGFVEHGILSDQDVARVVLLVMEEIGKALENLPIAHRRSRALSYAREEIKRAASHKKSTSSDACSSDAWCMFPMDDLVSEKVAA